MREETVLTMAP